MDGKGNIILDFFDVYGERPNDRVDVTLKHRELSEGAHKADFATTKILRINDLTKSRSVRRSLVTTMSGTNSRHH